MKWNIVAFEHPNNPKSVLYRQNITDKGLPKIVERAIKMGANLMSIRGFDDSIDPNPMISWKAGMEENVPMKIEMIPA